MAQPRRHARDINGAKESATEEVRPCERKQMIGAAAGAGLGVEECWEASVCQTLYPAHPPSAFPDSSIQRKSREKLRLAGDAHLAGF
jgi:hypothetical protein